MSVSASVRPQKSGRDEGSELKRLTVTINKEMDRALDSLMSRKGITKTEALRRLVLMGEMMAEADANGEEILIKSGDQTSRVRLV